MAYDDPRDGQTFMLIVQQALLIPKLKQVLLCPNKMRDHGLRVNDEPKFTLGKPQDHHHAITFHDQKRDDGTLFRIPMSLDGVISYFPIRKPTIEEWETSPPENRITITADSPEWIPSTDRFRMQEEAMVDMAGELRDEPEHWSLSRIIGALNSVRGNEEHAFHQLGVALNGQEQLRMIGSLHSKNKAKKIGPKQLSQNWGISLETAQRTYDATTQKAIRTLTKDHLSRRYRTNDRQLCYWRFSHKMYTDTLEAKVRSWHRKNKYAQVFGTRFGWTRVYPMRNKSDAHEELSLMAQRDGVLFAIVMDDSKEQMLGPFRRKAKEMDCHVLQTEPHSPWQNAAELVICELKRSSGRKALRKRSPATLWDHCIELESILRSNTATYHPELNGQVPETIMKGQTADISNLAEYEWYDWVVYWKKTADYPEFKECYGRWLGPAIDIGYSMTAKILQENGHVIYTGTHRPLTQEERDSHSEQRIQDDIDRNINNRLGGPVTDAMLAEADIEAETPTFEPYEDDSDGPHGYTPDIDDVTPEAADNYVGASVLLPIEGDQRSGKVTRCARDRDGNLVGVSSRVPILDTRLYEVEFPDGRTAEFSANAIAEHIYAQCDPDGNQYLLLDAIVDHKKDSNAVLHADRYIIVNGRQHHRKTTIGWKLCVLWKDGTSTWERLADLKESYPIDVAQYAIDNGIDNEPAFSWWVPYVTKKKERILAAMSRRYHKTTHKFGFEIPKTVRCALEIDRETKTTLWRDAIQKEMQNVRIAFKTLDDNDKIPPGYQWMQCHMIFTVKMDGFIRKARLVAGDT